MATRSITTTRPAVRCEVCGRNLLRGELPDVFVVGGERRTVCALCVGRAAHEGWRREGEIDPVSVHPQRGRRGRTLRGRLRQRRDLREADDYADEPIDDGHPVGEYEYLEPAFEGEEVAHDEAMPGGDWAEASAADLPPATPAPVRPAAHPPRRSPRSVHAVPTSAEVKAERALEVFNAGGFPRRVAGVARSLGQPWVTARSLAASGAVVSIVVSWELCWYRYEVDLSDEDSGARQVEQGLELDELPEEDREANAAADENGELHMLGA